ncbi:peroxisomal biogenesis factor 11 [Xylariomycetidae sp. FL0641]|nr:peroxisomal biogenesis factor 11 [Xylariomycetidae sp. FL0641]
MSQTFDQLVRFTTDAFGIERIIRFFHAQVLILSAYSLPFELVLTVLDNTSYGPVSRPSALAILAALKGRLGLIRKFFRLFRFLESFGAAQAQYAQLSSSPTQRRRGQHTEIYLDVLARTFNGMYLVLEGAGIVDALGVDGLALWAPQTERALAVEAQRFWLLSLAAAGLAAALRVLLVLAYTPVPAAFPGQDEKPQQGVDADADEKQQGADADVDEKQGDKQEDLKREQQRLRGLVADRKKGRAAWRREVQAKIAGHARTVVANACDITIPGSFVGWIPVQPGTVGVAMLISTLITGKDCWDRCGREVAAAKKG